MYTLILMFMIENTSFPTRNMMTQENSIGATTVTPMGGCCGTQGARRAVRHSNDQTTSHLEQYFKMARRMLLITLTDSIEGALVCSHII